MPLFRPVKTVHPVKTLLTLCYLFHNGYSSATVPLRDKLRDKLLGEIYFTQNIINGAVTLCNLFRSLSCNDLIFKIVVALSELLHYATYLAITLSHFKIGTLCNLYRNLCCITQQTFLKSLPLRHSLWIKENLAQPFGLPDWPNDRIYPQTTSQGRLLKRSISTIARRQLSCKTN
jgi:hypothetical protein